MDFFFISYKKSTPFLHSIYRETCLNRILHKTNLEYRVSTEDIIHLLTGYEGNSTFIVPKVRWYRGDNKSAITQILSL